MSKGQGKPSLRWSLSLSLSLLLLLLAGCGGEDGKDPAQDGQAADLEPGAPDAGRGGDRPGDAGTGAADRGPDAADGSPADGGQAAGDVGPAGDGGDGACLDASGAESGQGPCPDGDGDGLCDGEEQALGTDPARPDTDEDGTADGAERQAGTDPLDPASAPDWHAAALGSHPHLFFGPDELPALRRRAAAASGAHARLLGWLRRAARSEPPPNPGPEFDEVASQEQGRIAEAAAFTGLLEEDAGLLAKAVELLAAPFPAPDPTPDLELTYDIREAQALAGFCTAYDLLAGSPHVAAGEKARARQGLEARLAAYWQTVTSPMYRIGLSMAPNNHTAKVYAALGLCVLALPDRPEAAAQLNDAITGLSFLVAEYQATPDGGFAEGWSYLIYGANSYLPFWAAYHRFARGRSFRYRATATFTALYDPRAGQLVELPDPAEDERLRRVFRRALWAVFPDGRTPNTDDANPAALHGGLLAVLFDEPRFLHNWQLPAVDFASEYVEVATFALLDPARAAHPPDGEPEGSLTAAGFALFRDHFGPAATWLMIQGEHGPVRLHGLGHEQPDATNLLLWHRGEPLILDPGYINWPNRRRVNQAADHNLVLVDGRGPDFTDAFLEAWEAGPELTSVTVRSAWGGVRVARRVVRVQGRFFVVEDLLDPEDAGAGHCYTFQLNGNGGEEVADGSFVLLPDGGRWSRPNAALRALVLPLAGELRASSRAEEHAPAWGQWRLHRMLTVEAEMSGPAGFLTLLLLQAGDEAEPQVAWVRPQEGAVAACAAGPAGSDLALLQRTAGELQLALALCPGAGLQGTLTTGPGLSLVHFDPAGRPTLARQLDGGTLLLDGAELP